MRSSRKATRLGSACLFAFALIASAPSASASLTVLIGEPYGSFGTMMPVGHTAIYLDRVCADGPLKIRMCQPGEPQGVVVARYHRIAGTDWIATPIMQFLYATDRVEDIPVFATPSLVWEMRQQYRIRFLRDLVPDGTEKAKATDEWKETAGAAYDRRLWGYRLDTTREQDEAFVAHLNAQPNVHRYHLVKTNCADFAADDVVDFYYPGAVGKGRADDFGLRSPKQVARAVADFSHAHPELHPRVIEIPQVPGSLRRSRPVRDATEGLLKTKRYVATLAIIQPEAVVGLLVCYLDHGRWKIGQGAEPVTPQAFETHPTTAIASR